MQIIAIRTSRFKPGQDLFAFIRQYVAHFQEGDIVVVTSKIAALAENRIRPLDPATKRQIILGESDEQIETPWCLLTRRGTDWSANAGVDESNAEGNLILLPQNAEVTAKELRARLMHENKLHSLGVILTDTRIRPLQQGTLGIALGWAGLDPIKDYVGTPDLDGRLLKMTKANVIHALAAAAVLEMGEGAESQPLAIISGSSVQFNEVSGSCADLTVSPQEDLYKYLYRA